MARQVGFIHLIGTMGDVTFYKMEGQYYARSKSSLTRKRFRRDPKFARSRQSAARFGEATKLASKLYRSLSWDQRKYSLFAKLKTKSIGLIHAGSTIAQAEAALVSFLKNYLREKSCELRAVSGEERTVPSQEPRVQSSKMEFPEYRASKYFRGIILPYTGRATSPTQRRQQHHKPHLPVSAREKPG